MCFFLSRDVPSSAALPIIRPALGRQHSISDRAKVAMQGYLNHFLGNLDIVNSREVCLVHVLSRDSTCIKIFFCVCVCVLGKHGYVGSMIGACAFFKDQFL